MLPATLTGIGNAAFNACQALTTVTCLATTPPTHGGDAVFAGCPLIAIYVPYGYGATYKAASGWSRYSSIIYELDANGNVPSV